MHIFLSTKVDECWRWNKSVLELVRVSKSSINSMQEYKHDAVYRMLNLTSIERSVGGIQIFLKRVTDGQYIYIYIIYIIYLNISEYRQINKYIIYIINISCSIASRTSRFLSKLEFEQFSVECVFLTMASVDYPSSRFCSRCVFYGFFFYHLWWIKVSYINIKECIV